MRSRRMRFTASVIAILGLLLIADCRNNGVDPTSSGTSNPPPAVTGGSSVSFQSNVLPLFRTYGCTGCHGGTNGLFVGTVAQLLRGGIHGPAIVAGNAGNSLLIAKLSSTPPFGARMPQGGPYLPDSAIQTIKSWIDEGAPDN